MRTLTIALLAAFDIVALAVAVSELPGIVRHGRGRLVAALLWLAVVAACTLVWYVYLELGSGALTAAVVGAGAGAFGGLMWLGEATRRGAARRAAEEAGAAEGEQEQSS